ncbi:MerR family transcriptional regulator [Galactobacter caseinivorans]|uniref:MerR family transcriptional regulator n=1 Tax=Galactobacter caseinivorans TaxID=2676123 RepID=A0A496PFW8_9MICC|nr:TipAS antibiotic-recognition domain-containing protein [Galactobacter caseinivorans]RKW69413.1 MerR family transcriptional regulator [Galactobacter caseinivorans]
MEYPMREVVRSTGVTSRALRHYDRLGLLHPSSTGTGGERRYDESALLRLQRLLLLREVGLPLERIRSVLDRETDHEVALVEHVASLRAERLRLATQIRAVETTITALREKRGLSMNEMFEGFDHEQHSAEVSRRWGPAAAHASHNWWAGLDSTERHDWQREVAELSQAWGQAVTAGADPRGEEAQALAARHIRWLTSVPGTPAAQAAQEARAARESWDAASAGETGAAGESLESEGAGAQATTAEAEAIAAAEQTLRSYVLGLADLYVSDHRFVATFGGMPGTSFIRTALRAYFGEN